MQQRARAEGGLAVLLRPQTLTRHSAGPANQSDQRGVPDKRLDDHRAAVAGCRPGREAWASHRDSTRAGRRRRAVTRTPSRAALRLIHLRATSHSMWLQSRHPSTSPSGAFAACTSSTFPRTT